MNHRMLSPLIYHNYCDVHKMDLHIDITCQEIIVAYECISHPSNIKKI
jgi:hypothetical protein